MSLLGRWSQMLHAALCRARRYWPLSAGDLATTLGSRSNSQEHHYTAAHEAGHLLVYAALGRLPPEMKIVIHERMTLAGVVGYVSAGRTIDQLDSETFAQWKMLVSLAGRMGEEVTFGEATLGSKGDHRRWMARAQRYLANQTRGIYYPDPANYFEQEHNNRQLTALQAEQRELLGVLFAMNAGIFKELTATLLVRRTLDRAEIIEFLRRVQLPEGFPLPFGRFEAFSTHWPES